MAFCIARKQIEVGTCWCWGEWVLNPPDCVGRRHVDCAESFLSVYYNDSHSHCKILFTRASWAFAIADLHVLSAPFCYSLCSLLLIC